MKLNCDIIRDLLPSYTDKVLSESSIKIVEEHLKQCGNCQEYYKNMNKDIPTEEIFHQEDQVDYLKGYKKNKKRTIIFSIMITICILIAVFIVLFIYNEKVEYSYPINELDVPSVERMDTNKGDTLVARIENIRHNFKLYEHKEIDENNNTIIYLKFIGKCPLGPKIKIGTRTMYAFFIDESVDKIYFENNDGDLKEIWNKTEGTITQTYKKSFQLFFKRDTNQNELDAFEDELKSNKTITTIGHNYDKMGESLIISASGSNVELNYLQQMLESKKIIKRVKEID